MIRTTMIATAALLCALPALSDELPTVLRAEIELLIPNLDLKGRDFTRSEIAALSAAMHHGEDLPAERVTKVQSVLDRIDRARAGN